MPTSLLRLRVLIPLLIVGLLLVPQFGGRYEIYLATEVLIWALFALALNLMMGFGGLISFGHAAYFAIGAYCVAVFGTTLQWPFPIMMAAAIAVSAVASFVIGYFCVRLTSIFLSMLTLAFGQFIWAIAHEWRTVTQGDTGFIGLRVPEPISSPQTFYYFVLLTVLVCGAILWTITQSTYGRTLVSTRENAMRAEFVGVDVKRIQLIAFIISGTFSGIAGALFALFNRSVFPDFAWWTQSAEVLIMAILGGIYSFFGPAVGAAVIIILDREITEYTQYWPTVLGIILIIVLFLFPDGLAGLVRRWQRPPSEVGGD